MVWLFMSNTQAPPCRSLELRDGAACVHVRHSIPFTLFSGALVPSPKGRLPEATVRGGGSVVLSMFLIYGSQTIRSVVLPSSSDNRLRYRASSRKRG